MAVKVGDQFWKNMPKAVRLVEASFFATAAEGMAPGASQTFCQNLSGFIADCEAEGLKLLCIKFGGFPFLVKPTPENTAHLNGTAIDLWLEEDNKPVTGLTAEYLWMGELWRGKYGGVWAEKEFSHFEGGV